MDVGKRKVDFQNKKWTFITESIPVRVLFCAEYPLLYLKRYKTAIFVEYIPEGV